MVQAVPELAAEVPSQQLHELVLVWAPQEVLTVCKLVQVCSQDFVPGAAMLLPDWQMRGRYMMQLEHLSFVKTDCQTAGVAEAWAVVRSCWFLMLKASHRKTERLQGLGACSGQRQAGLIAAPLADVTVFEEIDPLADAANIQPGPWLDAADPCAACCQFWQAMVHAEAHERLPSVAAVR